MNGNNSTFVIGPDSYFSKNQQATSYTADTMMPIPARNTWQELSVPQLLEIKSRLTGYQFSTPRDQTTLQQSLAFGIAYLDVLVNTASQR